MDKVSFFDFFMKGGVLVNKLLEGLLFRLSWDLIVDIVYLVMFIDDGC